MDEHKQLIKQQFEGLPKALQDYVSSDVWSAKVAQICTQNQVPPDAHTSVENEVFFVLIGLEPPKNLRENIVKEADLDIELAGKITDTVHGSVLSPVMNYIKDLWKADNIGDSFTQAIVNQAKSLQPIGFVPKNLPTEEGGGVAVPGPATEQAQHTNNYASGKDPYREPIE